MANNCYFEMKIAGKEENVNELVEMLQWKGRFENDGLGRVYSFDVNDIESDIPGTQLVSVNGAGDCAWSVLTAMCAEYRKDAPSLESETKRLGLVVEVFSSEPGCCFQEHYLIDKGEPILEECVDYLEYWVEGMNEEEINELCEEKEISREKLMSSLNDNGDYCIGGFGDEFGNCEDLFSYFEPELRKPAPTKNLNDMISAAERKAEMNGNTERSGKDVQPVRE